jgi:phenylacetate-CoA ligase
MQQGSNGSNDSLGARMKRRLVAAYEATPIALRSGVYRDTRRLLERHRHASRAQVLADRDERIARLVEHAFAHVPYYRDVMQERGLRPRDVTCAADLAKLPLLGKDQVMEHHDRLVATNVPARLRTHHNTGGSTGRTLSFWIQKRFTMQREEAFIHDMWARVGWRPGDRLARIRGDAPPEPGQIARFVPAQRVLAISTYFLTADRAEEVVRILEDYDPHFLHVYPSTIAFLTHLFESRGLRPRLPNLKAILCGSENLYDGQRRALRAFWGVRPYVWYGLGEGCLLAGACEHSDSYHFFPEYGVLELVPNADAPDLHELVGTTLGNPVMPLIRYRTQDYARFEADRCAACGRPYDLVSQIEGRLQEFVVASDGRLLPVTSLIWGQHYECFGRVAKFQMVQDEPGVVRMRVVGRADFRPEDATELRDRTERATGGGLRVHVELVDEIEPTRAGKHKFVVQHLPLPVGE